MNTKTVKDIEVFLIYLCIIISQIIYLKKPLYKLGHDEKIQNARRLYLPQFCFVQTFRLKWKWKVLKVQSWIKYPFPFRKRILKGKSEVHIFIQQIIANTLKNKKTTTTVAKDPCHSAGKIFSLFQRLFPGQGFPLVFRATFVFCPCPLHCERVRSPRFLLGVLTWLDIPEPMSSVCALWFAVHPVLRARSLSAACQGRSVGGLGSKVRAMSDWIVPPLITELLLVLRAAATPLCPTR